MRSATASGAGCAEASRRANRLNLQAVSSVIARAPAASDSHAAARQAGAAEGDRSATIGPVEGAARERIATAAGRRTAVRGDAAGSRIPSGVAGGMETTVGVDAGETSARPGQAGTRGTGAIGGVTSRTRARSQSPCTTAWRRIVREAAQARRAIRKADPAFVSRRRMGSSMAQSLFDSRSTSRRSSRSSSRESRPALTRWVSSGVSDPSHSCSAVSRRRRATRSSRCTRAL